MTSETVVALERALADEAPARSTCERLMHQLLAEQRPLPVPLRLPVWRSLLGVPVDLDEDALSARIATVALDLPNQRVIRVDAERTRADNPQFCGAEMQLRIQRLLTFYTKEGYRGQLPRRGDTAAAPASPKPVPYKQGLNELLAVFLFLGDSVGSLSDGLLMALLSRFIAVFAPRIYAAEDSEFVSLQCSLRLLRLLMQYHAPQISALLDQHDVMPELYSTPWFLCLMARGNHMSCVLPLWDFLIACAGSPGPALYHCVMLAFLTSLHPRLVETAGDACSAAELPMVLTRAAFFGPEHVSQVCATALDYFAETPVSFRRLIAAVCYGSPDEHAGGEGSRGAQGPGAHPTPSRGSSLPISTALLARLEKRLAVKISVEELLAGASSRLAGGPEPLYVAAAHAAEATGVAAAAAPAATSPPGDAAGEARAPPSTDRPKSNKPQPMVEPSGFARLLYRCSHLEAPPRYFLLDCRPTAEFELGGHMPTAFHLDPALLHDPEALGATMDGFAGLKGVHFALMGSGDIRQWYHAPVLPRELLGPPPAASTGSGATNARRSSSVSDSASLRCDGGPGSEPVVPAPVAPVPDSEHEHEYAALRSGLTPISADEEDDYAAGADATRRFLLYFLQKGFLRVSEVEGGFTALHQHQAHFLATVLVNHEPRLCMVCSGGAAARAYAELGYSDAEEMPDRAGMHGRARRTSRLSSAGRSDDVATHFRGSASRGKDDKMRVSSVPASGSSFASTPSSHASPAGSASSVGSHFVSPSSSRAGSVPDSTRNRTRGTVTAEAAQAAGSEKSHSRLFWGGGGDRKPTQSAAPAGAAARQPASGVGAGDKQSHLVGSREGSALAHGEDGDEVEVVLFDHGDAGGAATGAGGRGLVRRADHKQPPSSSAQQSRPRDPDMRIQSAPAAAAFTRGTAAAADRRGGDGKAEGAAVAGGSRQHGTSSITAGVPAVAEALPPAAPAAGRSAARPSVPRMGVVEGPVLFKLLPLHREDLIDDDSGGVDGFGEPTLPTLREWVHLEQQTDELERAADLAARHRTERAHGVGSGHSAAGPSGGGRGGGAAGSARSYGSSASTSATSPRPGFPVPSTAAGVAGRAPRAGAGDSAVVRRDSNASLTSRRGSETAPVVNVDEMLVAGAATAARSAASAARSALKAILRPPEPHSLADAEARAEAEMRRRRQDSAGGPGAADIGISPARPRQLPPSHGASGSISAQTSRFLSGLRRTSEAAAATQTPGAAGPTRAGGRSSVAGAGASV